MATLISSATGNFTAAGTWKTASSVSGAELDSDANVINLGTGNSDSGTFILAATNVDAVAIKLSTITSPTGTLSVRLRNSTTSTDIATVTINGSDLPTAPTGTGNAGWYVFSFSAHTPNGTDSYLIRVNRSVGDSGSNRIALTCSTAAAANMCRMVRTVTTASPAVNDKLIVAGQFTGAGASTSYTVTMNNTATTSFGPTVSGGPPQGMSVNNKSALTFGTASSTNYYLKIKGIFGVYAGGTLNMGTVATPMPATSTASLEFDSVANVDSGLRIYNGGAFVAQGATKATVKTLLTVDAAASATNLTVASTSGWAASDVLWFASTSQTATECETKNISTVDSPTTLTLTAGLTNAHSGTSPTQGEIANITRNVRIFGASATLQGFVDIQSVLVTVDCDYAAFYNLGSGTGNKRGIDCNPTSGNANFQYCALYDFSVTSSIGFFTSSAGANNVVFSNNVVCNIQAVFLSMVATSGTNLTVDNNLFIRTLGNNTGVGIADANIVFTNNTVVGTSGTSNTVPAISINEANTIWGTFSDNTAHSNASPGLSFTANNVTATLTNFKSWRNLRGGISFNAITSNIVTLDSPVMFGNGSMNIDFQSATPGKLVINNGSIYGGTTFVAPIGIRVGIGGHNVDANSTVFGSPSAHSTADLSVLTNNYGLDGNFNNCLFGSSTELQNQANLSETSIIGSSKHDQTVGNHKAFKKYGTISIDTTFYKTASPSERLTPNDDSDINHRLVGSIRKVAIDNGTAATVKVWVRESVVGDGTDYGGSRIRLVVKRNDSVGITSDTVLATATIASEGAWEQLTGVIATVTDDGVLELYCDCNGALGWVNIDDWSLS